MMNEDRDTDLIDRYLKNALQGEELKAFEERVTTDSFFKKEVELQRRLVLLLKEKGLREMFQKTEQEVYKKKDESEQLLGENHVPNVFQKADQDVFPEENPPLKKIHTSWNTFYAVAAAIAFFLIVGAILYFSLNSDDVKFGNPQLATIAYDGDINPPFPTMGTRGASDTPPQYAPVLIYPPTGKYTFHYQFADTLRLYGNFDASTLSVSYQNKSEQYLLIIDSVEYKLQRNKTITPLTTNP
jgi:hypothetical protein